ncbi:MAG TPA: tRNA-dihydrouridine synthase, partial [Prolixibacteraceae bacterium]|nr:tRNA-dihydrouridine synthase [Prolixibacteraceae bacterium]
GDIHSYTDGLERIKKSGVDGVMIGRGIFQSPWFFDPQKQLISKEERIEKLIEHTKLFEQTWSGKKNFNILKRFYKIYLNSFEGAAKLRADLMEVKDYNEVYRYFGYM